MPHPTPNAPPPVEAEDAALLQALRGIVGDKGLRLGGDAEPHLREWRGLWTGRCLAVVAPAETAEAARVVQFCRRHGLPIVPQGGNTGLVGGQTPTDPRAVAIACDRMADILALDAEAGTITVQAGASLAQVQAAAAAEGLMFPVTMASEGSAQIGGAIATNAGGIGVLAHGSMRAQVLGLEVVLPDGRVWDGLRALRKDNTGYDLKQLFIGAEGTLGLITAAVLRLAPAPRDRATLWLSVGDPAAAVAVLADLRRACGPALTACELISPAALDVALRHDPRQRAPVAGPADGWHVLAEIAGYGEDDPQALVEAALAPALESGRVLDAALATSGAQRAALWALREGLTESQARMAAQIKHDIAVPVARVADFLDRADAAVRTLMPTARPVPFGHLGDGNVHYNIVAETPVPDPLIAAVTSAVHAAALACGGTISAEHGIGQLKRAAMSGIKSAVELDLMAAVKRALDPDGLMNPGKLLPMPADNQAPRPRAQPPTGSP